MMADPEWWEETYADSGGLTEPDPEAIADFTAFMTGETPPPTELVVAPNAKLERRQKNLERIETLTDEVLTEAMNGIRAAQRWHEVDPASTAPPEDWVEHLGTQEATRQWRIAMEANHSSKNVAYGLKMSVDVASGIMKARGKEEPARQLNVQFVQIQQPVFNYPSKRVER